MGERQRGSIGVDPEPPRRGRRQRRRQPGRGGRLHARDAGGPTLRLQLLVYPVTQHDYGTVSYTDNGDGYLLTGT